MKLAKLALSALVVWKVNGNLLVPCGPQQLAHPFLGLCIKSLDSQQEAKRFDNTKAAKAWAGELKKFKMDGVKVSDVHVYSEEGVK